MYKSARGWAVTSLLSNRMVLVSVLLSGTLRKCFILKQRSRQNLVSEFGIWKLREIRHLCVCVNVCHAPSLVNQYWFVYVVVT